MNELSASSVTEQSSRKKWWYCSKDASHVAWRAAIADRVNGTGCPACSKLGVSKEQERFFEILKRNFPELQYEKIGHIPSFCKLERSRFFFDAILPSISVAIEYDGHYWHRSDKARSNDRKKNFKAIEKGFYVIRIRQEVPAISPLDLVVRREWDLEAVARQAFQKIMSVKEVLENGNQDEIVARATPY